LHQISNFGPRWGAYSAPPDPLAGGEGARCPLPKNLTLLRASGFVPLPVMEKNSLPQNKFGLTPLLTSTMHYYKTETKASRSEFRVNNHAVNSTVTAQA